MYSITLLLSLDVWNFSLEFTHEVNLFINSISCTSISFQPNHEKLEAKVNELKKAQMEAKNRAKGLSSDHGTPRDSSRQCKLLLFCFVFRTVSFSWECFLNVNFDSNIDWLYFHICSFSKKREPQPSLITRSEADQSRGWQTLWERFYVSIMNTVFF